MPDDTTVRPRPTLLQRVVVAAIVLAVGWQLLAVTLAALPPHRFSEETRPAAEYLGPYFAQNWRLFAPNPISSDREVRFQGAYEQDGELVTTDWVDWTRTELAVVRHRLVGGRAGYVTNKMYGSLGSRYAALDTDQKAVADVMQPADVLPWDRLRADLVADSDDNLDSYQVGMYLLYDEAVTRLGTSVLESRFPDVDLVAVRWATRSQDVTPWSARDLPEARREAARPTPVQRFNGWREPLQGSEAEQQAVADFDRRHR